MSRDVLVLLLVLGLAANILLVAGVVWLNLRARRRSTTPAADPGPLLAADATDSVGISGFAAASSVRDADGPTRSAVEPPPSGPAEPGQLPKPARRPAARRTPRAGGSGGEAQGEGAAGRRSRRFVMPDEDGSHARTDRAIAAFLGEPVAPDPETRSTRRRHRARRPAGAPVRRTDLVLSLAGAEPDPRLVHALSAAMRSTVRSSDEVVELSGGRLRVTLEADVGGGEAFVRRARSVVKPWLTALDPDLQLRVERPRTRHGATSPS